MATSSTAVASAGRRGALAMLPMLAGYMPFALVIGSAAADRGTPLAGWAGSWLILGGSAHLATMRTLDEAGVAAAIFTGLLVNARLLVYSASLARRWGEQPGWFRFAAAGLIIDPTWVVADRHAGETVDLAEHRRYFLGAGLTLAAGWSGGMAVGAVLGARLDWLDLQIAVPLCLLALVGTGLRRSGTRLVIVVAGVVALLTASWPSGTGLLAAIAAGSLAGVAVERRNPA
jgi:predicted branched-subunit amino acid permease